MGLISTYPNATTPLNAGDTFIASDAGDMNATKTVMIQDIADFITSNAFFVPYTGALANVNLGTYTLTANSIIKTGGTSSQFLKADGSVDSNSYVPYTGANANVNLGSRSLTSSLGLLLSGTTAPFTLNGSVGTSGQVLKSNGAGATPSWVDVENLLPFQYGSFYDTTRQSPLLANTAYPMEFASVNASATNGISVAVNGGAKTLVTFPNVGVYIIQFSAQLTRGTGGTDQYINVWLKDFTNNANIAATNHVFIVHSNASYIDISCSFSFATTVANQQLQVTYAVTDINVEIIPLVATALRPSTPSTSLIVHQIA